MKCQLVLVATVLFLGGANAFVAATGHCIDLNGRTIPDGIHYVPGPDSCTLCVCDNGGPKLCKAVLCSPPQDCKSFRIGNSCCEFICLDDTLPVPPNEGGGGDSTADLGLRLVASGVTAILSLSLLFFLIHRLRQRRIRGRQNRQMHEDQRSLGSVGYITGSLGYLPGSVAYLNGQERVDFLYDEPPSHYPWWKPPENYFPRGEAPPPYEEAVAASMPPSAPPASTQEVVVEQVELVPNEVAASSTVENAREGEVPLQTDVVLEGAEAAALPAASSSTATAAGAAAVTTSSNLEEMNVLNQSTCSCTDDADDYRSECENCKSARGSNQYLDEHNVTPQETMTLHRRPSGHLQRSAHGYCTSLTLPSQARRHREAALLAGVNPDLAVQRFSLQLVLDWSDSSSSSLTLSPGRRTGSPSSSSETSSDINTHI